MLTGFNLQGQTKGFTYRARLGVQYIWLFEVLKLKVHVKRVKLCGSCPVIVLMSYRTAVHLLCARGLGGSVVHLVVQSARQALICRTEMATRKYIG